MKIITAVDSFKNSLSSKEINEAVKTGLLKADNTIEVIMIPVADGGEGTTEALSDTFTSFEVTGPNHDKITAFYGWQDSETAVIEVAAGSGIHLSKVLNPLKSTSYGTGELIKVAMDTGAKHILIGLGGSASTDCGFGLMTALGVKFLNEETEIDAFENILEANQVIIPDKLKNNRIKMTLLSDVTNLLLGEEGAVKVFGPQKGVTESLYEAVESRVSHIASLMNEATGKDVTFIPSSGAAGGIGAALMWLFEAEVRNGAEAVLQYQNFDNILEDADYVITGEGKMDAQTKYGKAPMGVVNASKEKSVPVIGLAGTVDAYEELYHMGFMSVFSVLNKPCDLQTAIDNTEKNVIDSAEAIGRLLLFKNELN